MSEYKAEQSKDMLEQQKDQDEQIKEVGSIPLENDSGKPNIQLLTIIGEIEGHEAVSGSTKATKYEHLLPKLAEIENDTRIDGCLLYTSEDESPSVDYEGYRFHILSVDNNMIQTVKIVKI